MRARHRAGPVSVRRRARWRDLRLWLGLGLIVGSMFLGASILSGGDRTVTVWRASRDLAVGDQPKVEPITVQLAEASSAYLAIDAPPQGRMRVPVAAGSLLPASAVGAEPTDDGRLLTLPVDSLHAPVGLEAGDVVDVWATAPDSPARPVLVLAQAHVDAVDRDDMGVGGEIPVVLRLASGQAAALIAAARGEITLVEVPLRSQEPVS